MDLLGIPMDFLWIQVDLLGIPKIWIGKGITALYYKLVLKQAQNQLQ